MIHSKMFPSFKTRFLPHPSVNSASPAASGAEAVSDLLLELEESPIATTLGWVTAALGAVALGLFVGRELRQRYKFNRRTPYDFYSHSGYAHPCDEMQELEFGVGI